MAIRYSDFLGVKPKKDIFDQIDDQVLALQQRGIDVIDFGVGDPAKQSAPPQYAIDALSQHAHGHRLSGYPDYRGTENFRQACCRYMQREFNVNLDPATELIATIGSKEAVFNFPRAFINPGDIVICPTPGYPPFHLGTKASHGIPYYVPLCEENNFLINLNAIPEEIAKQAKIIWINYPNSPTGTVAPASWYQQLIDWALKYNIIIAADEGAYIDLYYNEKPTSILELGKKNVVVFYSLSKRNNMTSYRVGFAAGDAEIIEGMVKLKSYQDNGVPQFIQDTAAQVFNDNQFVSTLRQQYRQKREMLISALAAHNLPETPSTATFFLWQKAPSGMTGLALWQKLIEIGIVTMPGVSLTEASMEPNPAENFIRFALMPTLEQTNQAAQRIINELQTN
ncbi:MAG: aminotransferase class I/II-fold pyridoxal phosphate-dependent enzyme [Gammaproteobacteria bacterium]|nr:aminotransferase class I/II-fold pyridoxal phosphate-dependent enzyme [Gammaproteobacteria bacterium]MCP4473500.1 aminotransferase class I/II-fold pyridoxal phosphate-dependent enzyme [Gammaproteobacteria bacterium]